MYVEAQVGNQCRKHSLNAFFGGNIFSWPQIKGLSNTFEQTYNLPTTHNLFNDVDYFNADGSSLLTWACDSYRPSLFYLVIPKNQFHLFNHAFISDRIMVFDDRHVWAAVRAADGGWFQLDSLHPTPWKTMRPYDKRTSRGIIVYLNIKGAWAYSEELRKNIISVTGGTVHGTETYIGDRLVGDCHPYLENWIHTRLRILSWLRGGKSRATRLLHHIINMSAVENKKLIVYASVMA